MPIYEYQCNACEKRFEELQRMSDDPLTTCSECGGELRKLLSSPAFQFKGTGWYVTDYSKSGADQDKSKSSSKESEPKESVAKDSAKEGSKEGAKESSKEKSTESAPKSNEGRSEKAAAG